MSSAHPSPPRLDVQSIDFPTDRLTLGQLRRLQSELWESIDGNLAEVEAISLFDLERTLANKAFALALGIPDPHPEEEWRDAVLMLDRGYQKHGLSTGPHQTQLLVRDFERAAAAQAVSRGGPSPK